MATILVVDDETSIVDVLRDLITDEGHTPITATNGHDALLLAQQHQPPLIITDVVMPVMDGYALLQAIRADPQLRHTVVMLMSATFNPEQTRYTLPTVFLAKPFDLSVITGFLHILP